MLIMFLVVDAIILGCLGLWVYLAIRQRRQQQHFRPISPPGTQHHEESPMGEFRLAMKNLIGRNNGHAALRGAEKRTGRICFVTGQSRSECRCRECRRGG